MPRNGSGTMSVPNTFTPATTISSSAVNSNFTDIGDEITNSVAADGQTTLTGALKGANGSASAPSYGFASDTNTGMYRKAADSLGFAVGGTEHGYIDSSGNWVIPTGALTLSAGVLTLANAGLHLLDTDASHDLIISPGSDLTADRTLTLTTGDADRTLTIGADSSISGTAYVSGGTDVPVADGGTGASNAAAARIALAALGAVSTQAFTSSGTWTKPSNCKYILVIGTGGGAGGGDPNSTNIGHGGGGAAGTCIELIDVTSITSETVTIGAGGDGGTSGGNGSNGEDTTFGAHFTAGGGVANSGAEGGDGGTGSSGLINISGGSGSPGGAAAGVTSGNGGSSFWGGGGRGKNGSSSGGDAAAYGAGGGGGFSTGSTKGGDGADGIVFVLEFGF